MKQPNSLHCFVCGLENPAGLHLKFYENGSGEVTAEITIPEQFQGYPGVVHGGIVAAMLDEIAGRSMMGGDPPRFMFTARLDIRYRRNVPVAQPLVLTGKAGSSKGRTATATGRICDSEGNLLAEAEALLVNVPDEMVDKTYLEALG
ncbi:MAG: PaaI family thioesterase, partial [Omnitrophica WOR_2 bacterium]